MPDREIIISFRNVSLSFDGRPVLEEVSFDVPRNRITVILGPSGVGKSVLIKCLVGLLRPDAGSILVDGTDVTKLSGRGLYAVRKKLGMLFQEGALFDSINVEQNVAFPLRRHRRLSRNEIDRIVAGKLDAVGLAGMGRLFPSELSGGMKKRAALARAIVLEPELLILDEPGSGLDPVTAGSIDELIVEMQQRLGITFVVISHDIPGTLRTADCIGLLHAGRLAVFGPREQVLARRHPDLERFLQRHYHSLERLGCTPGPATN